MNDMIRPRVTEASQLTKDFIDEILEYAMAVNETGATLNLADLCRKFNIERSVQVNAHLYHIMDVHGIRRIRRNRRRPVASEPIETVYSIVDPQVADPVVFGPQFGYSFMVDARGAR